MRLAYATYYKLKVFLGDKMLLIAMILIPLLISLGAGYALKQEKNQAIHIAWVDEDHSPESKALLERIRNVKGLNISELSRKEAEDLLDRGNLEEVFILKEGFADRIVRGQGEGLIEVIKAPASFSAGFAGEVIAAEVYRILSNHMAAGWVAKEYGNPGNGGIENLYEEALRYNDAQWDPVPLMTIEYYMLDDSRVLREVPHDIQEPVSTSSGILVFFMMFFVLFNSSWLIEERRNGTIKRLAAGPGAFTHSFFASFLALIAAGLFQVLMYDAVHRFVFNRESLLQWISLGVLIAYLLAVSSISLFFSAVLKTPSQLQAVAPVFALLTGFAGGCFWNLPEYSQEFKLLSLFTPQGWALRGIGRALMTVEDPWGLFLPVTVLLSLALILLPISYMIVKRQISH